MISHNGIFEISQFAEMRIQIVLAWQSGIGWRLYWEQLHRFRESWIVGGIGYASC